MSNIVIPPWLTDPEKIAPCPCGNPPTDNPIVVNGAASLKRWYHEPCLDFLKYELDGPQLTNLEEWRKHRRETNGP